MNSFFLIIIFRLIFEKLYRFYLSIYKHFFFIKLKNIIKKIFIFFK